MFFRIFTENNPVMGYSKNLFYSRSEGVKKSRPRQLRSIRLVNYLKGQYHTIKAGFQQGMESVS